MALSGGGIGRKIPVVTEFSLPASAFWNDTEVLGD
jgi:hypothetical protein